MRRLLFLTLLLLPNATVQAMIVEPRAVVSRVRADMRSLATALESYRLDHGAHPASSASPEWQMVPGVLTTPVAYLNVEIVDPFKRTLWRQRRFPFLSHVTTFLIVWVSLCLIAFLLSGTVWALGRRFLDGKRPFGEAVSETMQGMAWIMAGIALVFVLAAPGPPSKHAAHQNTAWADRPQGFQYWTDGTESWVLQSLGPDGDRDLEDLSAVNLEGHLLVVIKRLAPFAYDPTNGIASSGDIFRVAE